MSSGQGHTEVVLALRALLNTLVVATTGSTTLVATTTGYTRAAGSFITDGFAVGMEVTPSGFAANPRSTITDLTATTMTMLDARAAEGSAAGRTLAVGLPRNVAWENVELGPGQGYPYLVEDYSPGPSSLITLGSFAQVEVTPLYVLTLYVPAKTGRLALSRYTDALCALFAPNTSLTLATGTLRVRTDTGPYVGSMQNIAPGFTTAVVTIPLRLRVPNSI